MRTRNLESFNVPDIVADTAKALENKGFEAYLVGGCVRDLLLERTPKDWDITTNAAPDEIIGIFPETFYENVYGTVGVVNIEAKDETLKVIEITPYRIESEYSNKRHPDKVSFGKKLEEDLKRRDFTINAMALKVGEKISPNLYKGHIEDPYKGQDDLEDGVIRAVGNPGERFSEDALRMLRAIRISAEIGLDIDIGVEKAIFDNASLLEKISRERIRDEFVRIVNSDRPMIGLILSRKLGILKLILPELDSSFGVKQNQAHSYDVGEHSIRALQHAALKKWPLEVRLAALFHDIGKPSARRWSDEKKDWTFHGHDMVGAKMTTQIMAGLMFPKKTIDNVVKLVRWHMFFSDTDQITLSSVRRLLKNVGHELIWPLMDLRACDRIGTGRPKESPYRLRKFKSMIEEVMHDPITVQMLKIDGSQIIEAGNIKPGPKIGFILHILLEEVLENPELNTKDYLEKRTIELVSMSDAELEKIGRKSKDRRALEEEKVVKKIRDKYWVK